MKVEVRMVHFDGFSFDFDAEPQRVWICEAKNIEESVKDMVRKILIDDARAWIESARDAGGKDFFGIYVDDDYVEG